MSVKSMESAVRELTKSVISMQDKITALEKVVLDQSLLIKNLVCGNEDSSASVKSVQSEIEVGKTAPQRAARPMREARVRAASALSVNAAAGRRTKGVRNVSPALSSICAEAAEVTASSSLSAPPTPSASIAPQLEFVKTAPINHPQTHSNEVNNDNGGEWIEVTQRRSRRAPTNVTRGTAAPGSTVCGLLAAERKSYLHLYFVQIGTTTEQVTAYLRNICPDDNCSAEALKSRGDYASFKLTVPTKNIETYLKPEHWAEDVHIKPWRSGFRKPQQQAD